MSSGRRLVQGAVTGIVLLATSRTLAAPTVIDGFESATSPAPWTFSNGPEFPGATGSLQSGPGVTGKGAALAYDFSGGGSYVEMSLALPTPVTATALGFSARLAGVRAGLRVVDSTGQTLQYDVNRPLEAGGPDAWYAQVVDLSAPSGSWGGAGDGMLHEPVKAVSLLVNDSVQKGRAGVAGFDDVLVWDTLPATLDPDQTPVAPPPGSSTLASRLGVNIHFTSDDKALDIIAAAGITRVRMDLGWGGVEQTKGVYDFSAFDALVSSLAARGLTLHLILDYFNPIYPAPSDAGYASTTVPAFAAVSKATAAHFAGKGLTYEVWNEENGSFWPPAANASQYALLCSAAIAAVHAGDPQARVSTGGLAGFDPAFLEATIDAGGAQGADAFGVHPYRQGGGESVSDDLVFMRQTIAGAYPSAPPVWDTEWGYSSQWYGGDAGGHDPAARFVQAQRTSRELLSAWALGFPLEVYYDVRDDGTDPTNAEHNFGLVQNDYSDKPAVVALRTLTSAAKNRSFAGFLPVGFTSMHAMLLVGAADRVVALWSDATGSTTSVAIPATGKAASMLGATVPVTTDGGTASVVVREADGPVFVTFPNPPSGDAGVDASSDAGSSDGGAPRDASVGSDGSSADAGATAAHSNSGCGCEGAGMTRSGAAAGMMSLVGLLLLGFRSRRRS